MKKAKKETGSEKFIRLAEARTNKMIHMIHLLGNLSSKTYQYKDNQVDQIFTRLRKELDIAEKRLRGRSAYTAHRFKLGEPHTARCSASNISHSEHNDLPASDDCHTCPDCGANGDDAYEWYRTIT